jgi:archaemetzincin
MKLIKVTLIVVIMMLISAFKPPDQKQRQKAVGNISNLPAKLQRLFQPGSDFAPIEQPQEGDWLDAHSEEHQTVDQYLGSGFIKPDKKRNTIYLLPLGDFTPSKSPPLSALQEITAAYFMMEVKLLKPVPIHEKGFTKRINSYTKNRQYLAGDLLSYLKKRLVKLDDAFCILGITMEDLYPEESWNFVFGMASLYERIGVFSFARYHPKFYGDNNSKNAKEILLRRSAKVLVHEAGHIFGLHHCTWYSCGMAGSNHMAESDKRPIHLCPVCLRKLHLSIGFDPIGRYKKLQKVYKSYELKPEADWISKRLIP